jgi:hypothetical protein
VAKCLKKKMADIWVLPLELFLADVFVLSILLRIVLVLVIAFWHAKLTKKAGGICWQLKLANTEVGWLDRLVKGYDFLGKAKADWGWSQSIQPLLYLLFLLSKLISFSNPNYILLASPQLLRAFRVACRLQNNPSSISPDGVPPELADLAPRATLEELVWPVCRTYMTGLRRSTAGDDRCDPRVLAYSCVDRIWR